MRRVRSLFKHRWLAPLCLLLLLLTACGTPTPPPTPTTTPTITLTPSPTPTPTVTPTATPVPPITVSLDWPAEVSGLEPFLIEADVVPPPGVPADPGVSAEVFDAGGASYATFTLYPRVLPRYVSTEPLQLPLIPAEGEWRLVLEVASPLDVTGDEALTFYPEPVPFRDLTGVLPEGVSLLVPEAFVEVAAQGDTFAGKRIWRHGDEQLELWWAPGPAEPLLFDTAVVMLESTYEEDAPDVETREEGTLQEQPLFVFDEVWHGSRSGEGEARVIQGPDRWLYVLRLRAMDDEGVSPLLCEVASTFGFPPGE
ncbi:MAG: hypothetical protein ACLFU8_15970 [Anaerolineales bacterium]